MLQQHLPATRGIEQKVHSARSGSRFFGCPATLATTGLSGAKRFPRRRRSMFVAAVTSSEDCGEGISFRARGRDRVSDQPAR